MKNLDEASYITDRDISQSILEMSYLDEASYITDRDISQSILEMS